MTSGIYCIENLINGKKYIGGTKNFRKRTNKHKSSLNLGKHPNEILQRDWVLFGKNNFNFYIILECDERSLDELEEFYIFSVGTFYPAGYNLKHAGMNGKFSEYSIKNISKARIGNKNARGLKGKNKSLETIEKFRKYQFGRKKINVTASSKYVGVYKRDNGKWRAEIRYRGIRYCLGTFNLEDDAAKAYEKKYKEIKENEDKK